MIRMIGGEMAAWTEDRPPAGGALLAHLVDRLPPGTNVLVAGPHDAALIDALARRATVTCLVRSQPAAIELQQHGVQVLCGTLAKLSDTDRFELVVALDGLDRLCSVEGPQLDWAEALQALKRALRPGGTLLLAVENELGVHRLVDPEAATSAQNDGAWRPLGEFDASKPGNPTRLADRLAGEGLAVDWLGAAWPVPESPTLLATPAALRDGPSDALAAAAARAVGAAYAEKSVLSDPRRLAAAAVRGGLGPEFAASWLVVAHLAPRPAVAVHLPPVLLGDGPVVELAGRDDGWVRRVVRTEPGRDVSALNGPLPTGRLLEELLLAACLRQDLPALRRLLTGWTRALPATAADNVVVDGDTFAVLDPSVPDQPDVLRRFGRTLITGGYTHPWPGAADLPALTTILAAAAGRSADISGTTLADADLSVPDSRREHEEQLRAVHRRLADAVSRNEWYEQELDRKDRELRRARLQIAAFSGSVGFRMAKVGYALARRARNHLHKGQR
jgi:SAM-dependent methyltransferase